MDALLRAYLGDHVWILDVIAYIVLIASIVVRVTPTLRDDNLFLPIIKFVGKFLALESYGPKARP